ncbi:MAG: hypothetical protein ACK5LR_00890 [Mangrovibacterium sp.]
MIFRLLHNNKAMHFIALPILSVVLWLGALIHPVEHAFQLDVYHTMPLYQPFYLLSQWSSTVGTILAMLLSIATAFLLTNLNSRFLFLEQKTFLPAYLYLIIIGGLTPLLYLSPVYLVNIFGIWSIIIVFDADKTQSALSKIFNAGFIFGIGSLIYFNFIFLFPLLWIAFQYIHKNIDWRILVISLTGLLLPWLYVYTYYFFFDYPHLLFEIIQANFWTPEHHSNNFMMIYIIVLIALTLLSVTGLLRTLEQRGSTYRSFFRIFLCIGMMSILVFFFVPSASLEVIPMAMPPLAFILANYLIEMKRKFWVNALLYALLAGVIYLQLAS